MSSETMHSSAVDVQKLLMSIDATANGSSVQGLFGGAGKCATAAGSTSPLSLASSGAPSSSSVHSSAGQTHGDGGHDDKDSWFNAASLFMNSARNPSQMSELMEQIAALQGANSHSQILDAANGNPTTSSANLLSSLFNSQAGDGAGESSGLNSPSSSTPPTSSAMTTFTLPTTSAANSSEAVTPPAHASVIVSSSTTDKDCTPPPSKRSRQSAAAVDEPDFLKSALDNILRLGAMGGVDVATPATACDECGREFGNVFAMLTHKAQEHTSQENTGDDGGPGQIKCNECDKEFENMAYLDQHRLAQHMNSPRLFNGLFPPSLSHLPFMLHASPMHPQFGLGSGSDMLESPLSALSATSKQGSAVKRQYSSNGKNYCDLCNKEVCNKYFLRTHMLKMHGIVIDENKTVIANIDTLERERLGSLSFRCDTCLTEFKSRQQLRLHKQDVHGVLPLSTPGNRGVPSAKTSATTPTTPHLPPNGLSGSLMEEKCHICEKRLPAIMMMAHLQQEHSNTLSLPPDLSQMMAFLNQASRASRESEDKSEPTVLASALGNMYKCNYCQYMTRDVRNYEMHQERHERMNEAKRRRMQSLEDAANGHAEEGDDGDVDDEEEEDEALKLTTEAALKMMAVNQQNKSLVKNDEHDDDGDILNVGQAALNLSLHKMPEINKRHVKKDVVPSLSTLQQPQDEEKAVERNSHTSGSISPSGDSLPEGFGKAIGNGVDKPYVVQTFVIRSNDEKGAFLGEFLAHLPVRSMVDTPRQVVFELHPAVATTPTSNSL